LRDLVQDLDGARSRIAQLQSDVECSGAQVTKLQAAHEQEVREMNSAMSHAARKIAIMDELLAALNGRLKTDQARARELEVRSPHSHGTKLLSACLHWQPGHVCAPLCRFYIC
jgi:predicted RNase H-like nuclease (RuvC/YqgF family)